MRGGTSNERGAAAVMVAGSLLMLLGAATIAVDLSALRADRTTDQKITDNAASAGALAVFDGTGQDACEAALAYVAINASEIGPLDGSGCATEFSTSCTPGEFYSVDSGRFTVTVSYPVEDNHALMTSGMLGAPTQALVEDDGDPCDRVGVQISADHEGLFARALGFDQGTTTVHTVARVFLPERHGPPLNLVVLDRFGCDGIVVEGNAQVIVNPVLDPETGEVFPGLAAADSDASSCSEAVIRIDGNNARVRADGPPGCAWEVTPGTGHGCGLIQTLAPGTPGCNEPACRAGAGGNNPPIPDPTPLPERLTRMQIDHEYNCWGNYASPPTGTEWAVPPLTPGTGQEIPGCTEGTPAHIYDLIVSVGPNGPAGHVAWNADLEHPCNVVAGTTVTVTNTNVWVDCDDVEGFVVEGNVSIVGGDVIFQSDVHVKSQGGLEIRNTSSAPGQVVFRDGRFKKDGQASLTIEQTAVYLSNSSWLEISGGSNGALRWIAPSSGKFEDLALWSDSPLTHFWQGQGQLSMVGVFFTPWATAEYSGQGQQNQTQAQWVAHKLRAHGQGVLEISPDFEFPFKRDHTPQTMMVR